MSQVKAAIWFTVFLTAAWAAGLIAPLCTALHAGENEKPTTAAGVAAESLDYAKTIRPLLAQHCLDCHGQDAPKAGLRLDSLAADFDDPAKVRIWTKVLTRVAASEMPPQDSLQPSKHEARRLTAWIETGLLAAERRTQPAVGSLALRRLNRRQYENTIRDLLAIKIELQDRLPEDSRALGFDNIGSVLSLSSAQMEAYLEAADAALDAAIVTRPQPVVMKQRRNGLAAVGGQGRKDGTLLDLEDAVVTFGPSSFYASTPGATEEGLYRVRLSAYGYQSQGKPLEIYVRSMHKTGDRVIGYYNVPPDSPSVIEFTCYLKKEAYVSISTSKLRYVPRMRSPRDQTDPGLAVQWVEMEGPLVESWPPASHKRLFGELPMEPVSKNGKILTVAASQPLEDAERLLRDFMRRAFRRPVSDEKARPLVELVKAQLESGQTFEESMRVGFKAVLCSPDFLFFQEKHAEADEFALASRLSYFLWNTLPDDELLALAERGELSRPEKLRGQVERLLNDAKAQGFIQNFLAQWLDLRQIDFTMPDRKLYPEFDTSLRQAIAQETELFFTDMLKRNLSVTNFVSSEHTFLNERLAKHYEIEGVNGTEMRLVTLPPGSHRGGVLTMASVLKVTANGSYTHPVHRGVWILKNILGQPPDPPPPNAGAIEPDLRGATTIREQLTIHRKAEACAGCHVKIDPLGFSLENFDVTGMWREKYRVLSGEDLRLNKNGPPVEANYELADGRSFQNIDELKALLLENKPQLARCLAEKLLIYSTGRGLRFSDRAVVERVLDYAKEKDYGLRTIVHEVVQSSIFLNH